MGHRCPFCKLVESVEENGVVVETERALAFMDSSSINTGHVLVVPRRHTESFYELGDDDYSELMSVVKRVASVVDKTFEPRKVGMLAAGFDVVPHAHVHVIPMHEYHDITSKAILDGTRATPSREELERVAARIRRAL